MAVFSRCSLAIVGHLA